MLAGNFVAFVALHSDRRNPLDDWNQQLSLQLVFGSGSRIVQIIFNAELGTQSHALF
jgi:hypothetical protein